MWLIYSLSAVALLLPGLVLSQDNFIVSPDHDQFRCLACERGSDLMCYYNQSCEAGKEWCYVYKWDIKSDQVNEDLNEREWGCTTSNKTCHEEAAERGVSKAVCCYANTFFNDTSLGLNLTEYMTCIYGYASASSHYLPLGLLGASLFAALLTT